MVYVGFEDARVTNNSGVVTMLTCPLRQHRRATDVKFQLSQHTQNSKGPTECFLNVTAWKPHAEGHLQHVVVHSRALLASHLKEKIYIY